MTISWLTSVKIKIKLGWPDKYILHICIFNNNLLLLKLTSKIYS